MMYNRIICSVILMHTFFLPVGSGCFAASLPPAPISHEEVIDNPMAIDDGSITLQSTDCPTACLPGQIESDCVDSQEALSPSDTDNLIALWNAFDLPNKR